MSSSGSADYDNPPRPPAPEPPANIIPYGQTSPFNPQFMSFLPASGTQSAMLGDQPYFAPSPTAPPSAAAPPATAAAQQPELAIPDLAMPPELGRMPPNRINMAQQTVDAANQGPRTLEGYLAARDQLARLLTLANRGGRGSGGYTTSAGGAFGAAGLV